jgi:hypothetical protein
MAIIEEGENHFVMAAYSNRLCDPDQGSLIKCVREKKKYHFHMNHAGLPVPDKQPVVEYVATLRYHTKEITAYFIFAIPHRSTS